MDGNEPQAPEACNKQKLFGTHLTECLEQKHCIWAMHYGNTKLCMHPELQETSGLDRPENSKPPSRSR